MKLWFVDADPFFGDLVWTLLNSELDFTLCPDSPDIVFFGVWPGNEVLSYRSAKRVFLTQECVYPDFNISDYGISFFEVGDTRFLRVPSFVFYPSARIAEKGGWQNDGRKFCSFMCSNQSGSEDRLHLFDSLFEYKMIHSYGKVRKNSEIPNLADDPQLDWHQTKLLALKNHKFSLVVENSSYPGYTTEKIVDALAVGSIPIYWGDPNIGDWINEEMIVVATNRPVEEVVEEVRYLDENAEAFRSKRQGSPFTNSLCSLESEICKFVAKINECDGLRRNDSLWGGLYESRLNNLYSDSNLVESTKKMTQVLDWPLCRRERLGMVKWFLSSKELSLKNLVNRVISQKEKRNN